MCIKKVCSVHIKICEGLLYRRIAVCVCGGMGQTFSIGLERLQDPAESDRLPALPAAVKDPGRLASEEFQQLCESPEQRNPIHTTSRPG